MRAGRAGGALAVVAATTLLLLTAAVPAGSAVAGAEHLQDGQAGEWSSQDTVAVGQTPARGGSAIELSGLLADDNQTHFFFGANYTSTGAQVNGTLAFYFFGAQGAANATEPRGLGVGLTAGGPLSFAVYLDLGDGSPDAWELTYFDGSLWQNRTLQELGGEAARNDTVGLVELALPRQSLLFLEAGQVAVVLFDGNGTALDAVPDLAGQPPAISEAAPFYDYSLHPPISFTAIGFSNPGAAEGQPVLLFLQLTNSGPKTATDVSAHVLADGEPLGAREGLSLLPGGTAVMNFSWTAQAGIHNFTATSFPGGAQRTITAVFSGAAAVLVIEDVRVEPSPVYRGTDFHVMVTVRNLGEAPSGDAELLLKDATRIISTASVPVLPPGEAANASLGARFDLIGTRTLRVEVDGVNTPEATREVQVPVTQRPEPFFLPLEVLAAAAVLAFGVGVWFLTPRLLREEPPKGPEGQ